MIFKTVSLVILTLFTIRQAIISIRKQNSTEDNKMGLTLFVTVTMWMMILGAI